MRDVSSKEDQALGAALRTSSTYVQSDSLTTQQNLLLELEQTATRRLVLLRTLAKHPWTQEFLRGEVDSSVASENEFRDLLLQELGELK